MLMGRVPFISRGRTKELMSDILFQAVLTAINRAEGTENGAHRVNAREEVLGYVVAIRGWSNGEYG